jgi:RND family efflux transporter MFP subunit
MARMFGNALSAGLLAGVLLATSACNDHSAPTGNSGPPKEPRSASVAPAKSRNVERTITVFGSYLPREQATLSTKVSGRLKSVSVDLGSSVKAGDELARIESHDYELGVRQARAALSEARARLALAPDDEAAQVDPEQTSLVRQAQAVLREASANRDRIAQLHTQGVLSQAELDSAEAAFAIADNRHQVALEQIRQSIAVLEQRQVEYDIAAQQLTDTVLRAPFNASVQERKASPGEFLRAGDPVVTLVQMNPLRLRLEVSERDAPMVRAGLPVRAWVEGMDEQRVGNILRVSPAIDPQRRVLFVEADIPNDGRLHPGMFARAEIVVKNADPTLTVPTNAVVTFAGIEKVFLIADGKASERVITTGVKRDDWVEVLENLKPGENVILNPGKLQNGQPVETARADKPAPPQS